MNIQVYTAIVGNHDPMHDNIPVLTEDRLGDPLLSARFYKTCPHLLFPNADWTIWIDGNVFLNVPPEILVERCLEPRWSSFGVFAHAHRATVGQEAGAIRDAAMDSEENVARALELYGPLDTQRMKTLAMTMVLVRRNTRENAQRNAAWWQSICYSSMRDQLTFPLYFPGPYWPTVDFTQPNEFFTRIA
jgi:hypothetical protein